MCAPLGFHPLPGQRDCRDTLGLCAPLQDDYPGMLEEADLAVFEHVPAYLFESRLLIPVPCPPSPLRTPLCPRHLYSGKLSLTNSPQGQSVSFIIIFK